VFLQRVQRVLGSTGVEEAQARAAASGGAVWVPPLAGRSRFRGPSWIRLRLCGQRRSIARLKAKRHDSCKPLFKLDAN
jgi:hypothetical protein